MEIPPGEVEEPVRRVTKPDVARPAEVELTSPDPRVMGFVLIL